MLVVRHYQCAAVQRDEAFGVEGVPIVSGILNLLCILIPVINKVYSELFVLL
jgi:hypothetical protein